MSVHSRWAVEFWEELHKASCVHVPVNTETLICTHTHSARPDDAPLHIKKPLSLSQETPQTLQMQHMRSPVSYNAKPPES